MEELYTYIAVQLIAPENAMRQYDRIAEAILTLDRFSERFGCFHTEPEYSMGIRRMVVDNFLVCYVIEADVVTVTNVLYGASDVRQRLKNHREGWEGKSLLVHECLVADLNTRPATFFVFLAPLPFAGAAVIPVLKYRYWVVAFVKNTERFVCRCG